MARGTADRPPRWLRKAVNRQAARAARLAALEAERRAREVLLAAALDLLLAGRDRRDVLAALQGE